MILVLEPTASKEAIERTFAAMEELGLRGELLTSLNKPLIHIVEGRGRRAKGLLRLDTVQALIPTSGPRIRRVGRHFFPYHLLNWLSVALPVVGVLVVLAGFFPPGVGNQVEIGKPAPDVIVPWYAEALAPFLANGWLGWLSGAGLVLLALLLPLVDRTRGEGLRARLPVMVVTIALALLLMAPLLV